VVIFETCGSAGDGVSEALREPHAPSHLNIAQATKTAGGEKMKCMSF
jgi:hypothetical protein